MGPYFPANLGGGRASSLEPLRGLRLACPGMDFAYLPFILMGLILAMILVASLRRKRPDEDQGDGG